MLYIITVAYKEFYWEKTQTLINSVKQYLPEANIYILTDNTSYYNNYDVMAIEGPICEYKPYFKANIKAFALNSLLPILKNDDIVLYLDADCYFINPFPKPLEDHVQHGLTVHISDDEPLALSLDDIENIAIREKILSINPDKSQRYYVFREGFLLFKIDDKFSIFVKAWLDIFKELEEKNITQANQTFDIQNAALRADLPIFNVNRSSPLRSTTVTVAVNGGVNCLV